MGALFALVTPRPSATRGMLFGLGVWAVNYAGILPQLGLMPAPSLDRPGRPTSMILAHVVYGLTLAATQDAARLGTRATTRQA